MLYLHCGWMKTGTSSLQDVLYRHREELAAVGLVYPDRWLSSVGPNHHGIAEMLAADHASGAGFDEVTRFLAEQAAADRDVVVSAEELTNWLLEDRKVEVFRRFLEAAGRVTPVKCVWTLRRLDETLASLYRWHAMLGTPLPPAETFFADFAGLRPLFAGMRRLEEAPLGGISYVRYMGDGLHQEGLLRSLGLPDPLVEALFVELIGRPRLNVALSHKQAVALLCADSLAERIGLRLDASLLRALFSRQGFEFERDGRWRLVDGEVARALHARALEESERCGFPAYAEFFSRERIPERESTPISPDVLSDADLARLLERLRRSAPAQL